MKHLGMIPFFGGMLVAICCGAKLTDEARQKAEWNHDQSEKAKKDPNYKPVDFKFAGEKQTFPSSLPFFCVAIGAAIGGAVAWRIDASAKRAVETKDKGKDPLALLSLLHHELSKLQQQLSDLETPTIADRVDSIIDNLIFPFNQVRDSILTQYGMSYGAEILVTFAGAERSLNRAWSASSDGHREEAFNALAMAAQGFAHADELAQKKKSG